MKSFISILIVVPLQGKYLCFYIANLTVNKYTYVTRAFKAKEVCVTSTK